MRGTWDAYAGYVAMSKPWQSYLRSWLYDSIIVYSALDIEQSLKSNSAPDITCDADVAAVAGTADHAHLSIEGGHRAICAHIPRSL